MKRNQYYPLIFTIVALCFSCGESDDTSITPPVTPPPVVPPVADGSGIGEARDISSFDLLAEMGVGWNLGNSMDVTSRDKTYWGNPITTQSTIEAVKQMGFTTLRIPITWGPNQDDAAPYTIESNYLREVKRIVDYGFKNRMHVIINVHHDNDWVIPDAGQAEESKLRLASLWTQVSEYFIDYNDSLIFETLNEPRIEGSAQEWSGGTPEGRAYINDFHQVAVDAIRATGKNNALRHIMITTWAASTVPDAMNDLVIPNDDPKVIISLHSYFPWAFAGEASVSWGSEEDKLALEGELDKIHQKWIVEEGRPVILGEWGSIDSNNRESRNSYAGFYAKEAAERGLLTVVWDDGGMFRLYNRTSQNWDFGDIASTIVSSSN